MNAHSSRRGGIQAHPPTLPLLGCECPWGHVTPAVLPAMLPAVLHCQLYCQLCCQLWWCQLCCQLRCQLFPAVLPTVLPAVLQAVLPAVTTLASCVSTASCVVDGALQTSPFQLNCICSVRETTGSHHLESLNDPCKLLTLRTVAK
jgi:hypothetical protein